MNEGLGNPHRLLHPVGKMVSTPSLMGCETQEILIAQTLMVPFAKAIVLERHLNDNLQRLTPPPGLLELG